MASTASTTTELAHSRARMEDIQRARLLAATCELVGEHGVGDLTVAQVAGRAGVSRRTFYELFRDCEDCLLAAIDEASARLVSQVREHYDPSAQWVERVRSGLSATLAFLDAEPAARLLLFAGSQGAYPAAQEDRERLLRRVVVAVDEGRKQTKAGPKLPPLTAEGVVGGALSILQARMASPRAGRAIELLGPLMSMIVLPYLGNAAAQRELDRSVPSIKPTSRNESNPLGRLGMRVTYRTVRVLAAIEANPGASNRRVGRVAGVLDQGQISKLLARLDSVGLVENAGGGAARGAANAWTLTDRGREVQATLAGEPV